jgi:hypothetical protein
MFVEEMSADKIIVSKKSLEEMSVSEMTVG